MVFKLLDRVRQSVSGTPGTGVITLSAAVSGYQSFSDAGLNNNDTTPYSIDDQNATWEYGLATYSSTSGGQITRTVTKSSSGAGVALSLTSKAIISATARAEDIAGSTTLAGLADVKVNPGSGINGYSLVWDESLNAWTDEDISGGGGSGSLSGLSDVTIASPTDDEVLMYKTGSSKWHNEALAAVALSGAYSALSGTPTIPTNGSFNLSSLGDVTITSLSNGQVLEWNSTASKWENVTPSGGGGSGVTVEDSGTSVGTGITTLNFDSMASVTVSGTTATITGNTGGGGGGGSAPTIVQSGVFAQGDAPYTMGASPTPGNLLVALVSHWSSSITVGAGWTMLLNVNGSNDCESILIKVATSADTSSLSPCTTSNDGVCTTIFELSDAAYATPILLGQYHDNSSTSQSISTWAPSKSMVLGHFTTTNGDTLPTSISGVTAGSTVQESSGTGSGYPRGVAAFYDSVSSGATITAAGTYASSVDANGAIIVIQGTGTV